MADPLHTYVARRLKAIQRRRNFHPEWGVKQLEGASDPRVHRDFGEFSALLDIARRICLDVPYDPAGLDPLSHSRSPGAKPSVYFGRLNGSDTCKIGYSKSPERRRRSLQTGNQDRISMRYTIPEAGREVEQALLEYTRRYESRGRGGTEWRDGLTLQDIRTIIRRIKTEGPGFLKGPRLRRMRHGKVP